MDSLADTQCINKTKDTDMIKFIIVDILGHKLGLKSFETEAQAKQYMIDNNISSDLFEVTKVYHVI